MKMHTFSKCPIVYQGLQRQSVNALSFCYFLSSIMFVLVNLHLSCKVGTSTCFRTTVPPHFLHTYTDLLLFFVLILCDRMAVHFVLVKETKYRNFLSISRMKFVKVRQSKIMKTSFL
jgi:hypothetical protein